MKMIDCAQLSPEWFLARCGIPTASSFDKIVTTKGEQSKQRQKYMYQLAGEKIIGKSEETYQNANMTRGQELESEARKFYQVYSDNLVSQVGFCLSDCGSYGASPDGLVGEKGMIQIKCPLLSTHVGYLLDNKLPTDYFQQVQGELLVSDREWSDFISYYPGMRPLIVRVDRDENFIKSLKTELEIFHEELEDVINKTR